MKYRFLRAHLAVPFSSIWLCTQGNAISSGARSWLLTAYILKIVACLLPTQRLSCIRPFWSLFSLTTISLVCYSNRKLVPISQRMPGTWARTLCGEAPMSISIIAFPIMSATTPLPVAPIDAAAFLWQVDCRRSVLPMVICSQPITSSLARTMSVSQDHAGQQAHRVDCRVPTQRVMADHFYQFM